MLKYYIYLGILRCSKINYFSKLFGMKYRFNPFLQKKQLINLTFKLSEWESRSEQLEF